MKYIMKILKLQIVLLLMCCCSQGSSQTLNLGDFSINAKLLNSEAIMNGSSIYGYAFFLLTDKVDKDYNEYSLIITDPDLNKLKEVSFVKGKKFYLGSTAFNGTNLLIYFYNGSERKLDFQIYDMGGVLDYEMSVEISLKEQVKFNYDKFNGDIIKFFPIQGKGFVADIKRFGKPSYNQIYFITKDIDKRWIYTHEHSQVSSYTNFYGVSDRNLFVKIVESHGYGEMPRSFITTIDLLSGKLVNKVRLIDDKFKFDPIRFSIDKYERMFFVGEYFSLNSAVSKSTPLGYAVWVINDEGKIIQRVYLDLDTELSKFLNIKKNGKIEDFGFPFLHNVINLRNGETFLITEGIKGSNITDLILIKLDTTYKIESVKKIEKWHGRFYSEISNSYRNANYALMMGYFDYKYFQKSDSTDEFIIYYTDYLPNTKDFGRNITALYYNGIEYKKDYIRLRSDADYTSFLRSEIGKIIIFDYYKKEKRISTHLERFNF